MAVFLIAAGRAFELLAQANAWRSDRRHTSLVPSLGLGGLAASDAPGSLGGGKLARFQASDHGARARLHAPRERFGGSPQA
jgi:hypothetical protein